ncbi:MAG: NUDIX domain-containing protein, partial [Alphaproteobacteria bacterium]
MKNIVTVVAAALIDPDGRVLLAQRPESKAMAGLWEFPGG